MCPRGCGAAYGDVSSATTASRSRRQRTAGNRWVVGCWWGDCTGRASAIVVEAREVRLRPTTPRDPRAQRVAGIINGGGPPSVVRFFLNIVLLHNIIIFLLLE